MQLGSRKLFMNETKLDQAVAKRRTFAIISHPDAGKTTITEQLLLFGGVVREAGLMKLLNQMIHNFLASFLKFKLT